MMGRLTYKPESEIVSQIRAKTASRPPRDIHIYLMKGIVRDDDEALLGHHFLGNWVEEGSSFLFFSIPSSNWVDQLLAARPGIQLEDQFHFTYEEWQGGGLEPVRIDPFLIAPPWLESDPHPSLMPILLDPGVVFGNCHHPTTQACLKALALAAQRQPLGRVLDLGTGTGILALAAARLGAREVMAVDLNPLCVKTAVRNVELNDSAGIVHVMEAKAEDMVDASVDLIIANIHYEVIIRLLRQGAINPDARLIISGLLRSQYRDVIARLRGIGFKPAHEWDHDMTWYTVLASRHPVVSGATPP